MDEAGRLLTEKEAAEYLAVAVATLRCWRLPKTRDRAPIPYVKLGTTRYGAVRYRKADLDAYIAANTVGGGK